HTDWGSRFVAITDQDTALHRRATTDKFRDIFVNPADIGGRYSALSLFGLVPAALMGLDIEGLLDGARSMAQACRNERASENRGLALGALLGAGARAGRDKLTLWVPPQMQSFGLWVEQLVAESTGKHGKGVVPITGETSEARFGADRLAVVIRLGNESPDSSQLEAARSAGVPTLTLDM